MIERRIVRRYASALFAAAQKADLVDRIESDLGFVSYVFETSPDLLEAMTSPRVPRDVKKSIVDSLFVDKVDDITLSYVKLLVDKRREEAITLTEQEYLELANEARGVLSADVTTAVRLSEDEEARLREKLSAITGKTVLLTKTVDPRIMGGVVVRVGDKVMDGSIRGQLAALKDRFLS